jgi:hypothetical protein
MDRRFAGFALALLLCAGCGPPTVRVSGNVTLDGQPVPSGIIAFAPAEGTAPPVTASIADGAYSATLQPGKKLVQISAPVVAGTRKEYNAPDAPTVEVTRETVPPRYNSQSELSLDVTDSLEKDFALEGALK